MTITGSDQDHIVTSAEELDRLYGTPGWIAFAKEIDHVSDHYRAFIEAAPFCVLATSGEAGVDCSPRGGAPGFVRVADSNTLLIPDVRGNNRIDTLRNLIADSRLSVLFLIPGCGETLRVVGRAAISVDPMLLESFGEDGKGPRSVLIVTVERVFYQCASAIHRSKLWDASCHIDRKALPSTNAILASIQWNNVRGAFRLGGRRVGEGRPVAARTAATSEEIALGAAVTSPEPL